MQSSALPVCAEMVGEVAVFALALFGLGCVLYHLGDAE